MTSLRSHFTAAFVVVIAAVIIAHDYAGFASSAESSHPSRRRIEMRGVNMDWVFYDLEQRAHDGMETPRLLGTELKLRTGDIADFEITSDDYLYILTMPDGQREIGVPDMRHRLTYVASSAGRFELMMDSMCGFRFLNDDVQGVIEVTD